jgi:curved DNA-binding protein CbpA
MEPDVPRHTPDHHDPYDVLGVSPTATAIEITRAYRRLVRRLHPDTRPERPGAGRELAEVLAAYELLGDPARRAEHDRRCGHGRRARSERPADPGRSAPRGVAIPVRIRRPAAARPSTAARPADLLAAPEPVGAAPVYLDAGPPQPGPSVVLGAPARFAADLRPTADALYVGPVRRHDARRQPR